MKTAEDNKQLTNIQFVSKIKKDIDTAQVEKHITCDYHQIFRKPMMYIYVDGVSCYDWIVAAVGLLVCKKYGLHQKVSDLILTVLSEFKYRTLTAYGHGPLYENTFKMPLFLPCYLKISHTFEK